MHTNFVESLNINGHLQIAKVFKDGSETIVFDDPNVIVSGMSYGLSILFGNVGSSRITDFQLDRFQIGTGGTVENQVSSTFQLTSPLTSVEQYVSDGSRVLTKIASQYKAGSIVNNQVFGVIPHSKITRVDNVSVRYTMILDENAANYSMISAELNEIGLFMKNPSGNGTETSVLCAYRYFSPIEKTSDFSLVFRWTINF